MGLGFKVQKMGEWVLKCKKWVGLGFKFQKMGEWVLKFKKWVGLGFKVQKIGGIWINPARLAVIGHFDSLSKFNT